MMPVYYVSYTRQNNYYAWVKAEDEEKAKAIVEDDLLDDHAEQLQSWGEAKLIFVEEEDLPFHDEDDGKFMQANQQEGR